MHFLFCETKSHCVVQVGFELRLLLPCLLSDVIITLLWPAIEYFKSCFNYLNMHTDYLTKQNPTCLPNVIFLEMFYRCAAFPCFHLHRCHGSANAWVGSEEEVACFTRACDRTVHEIRSKVRLASPSDSVWAGGTIHRVAGFKYLSRSSGRFRFVSKPHSHDLMPIGLVVEETMAHYISLN